MLSGFPTCKEAPDMILNFLLGVVSSKGFGYLRVDRAMNDHKVTFLSFQTYKGVLKLICLCVSAYYCS